MNSSPLELSEDIEVKAPGRDTDKTADLVEEIEMKDEEVEGIDVKAVAPAGVSHGETGGQSATGCNESVEPQTEAHHIEPQGRQYEAAEKPDRVAKKGASKGMEKMVDKESAGEEEDPLDDDFPNFEVDGEESDQDVAGGELSEVELAFMK